MPNLEDLLRIDKAKCRTFEKRFVRSPYSESAWKIKEKKTPQKKTETKRKIRKMNDDLVKNIMFQEKSFDLKKGRKKHIKAEEKE